MICLPKCSPRTHTDPESAALPCWDDVLSAFTSRRVLVVGDVMLDDYWWGNVRRICPEAPVPIVESRDRSSRPGGAANAAANIAALGGMALLASVTGNDNAGQLLREALQEAKVDSTRLLASDDRPTTSKTRIIAHSQQVLRIDTEQTHPIPNAVAERLAAQVEELMADANAMLLCDYAKGVLSAEMTRRFIEMARQRRIPVVVDPKGRDYERYRGATVIKPNIHELEYLFRRQIRNTEDLHEAAGRLTKGLDVTAVLVTQGADGMTLFRSGELPWRQSAAGPRPVFDVTGAGDTVVGVISLMLACEAPLTQAIQVANIAANIAVGKLGTAVVHPHELREALASEPYTMVHT